MAVFEIKVNSEYRFRGDDVTAITLVSDVVGRHAVQRIAMHVGTGGPGNRETHYLAANLVAGDEITIRVLKEAELQQGEYPAPEGCSFCGNSLHNVQSLVAARHQAICDSCLASFSAVVLTGAALPVGASICESSGGPSCAFCDKAPPDVPALLVRNDAAICPGCLRSCVDVRGDDEH
jgi:ClpX C4-type zinc finger